MEYTLNIDELIAKRLADETDARENTLLEKWLAESADNRHYFNQMQRVWQQSEMGKNDLPKQVDVEAALARTKWKIREASAKNKAKRLGLGPWWMALAASLVLAIAAIWFFQPFSGGTTVMIAARETPLRDTLGDGSVVALNQQSSLSATFGKTSRRVKMRGEAYFDVAHQPDKPFVIDVKKVEVTVVGTKFNIDNRTDSTKVVVSVEEGKVRVQSGSEIIFLTIGEQATIDCQTGAILRSRLPASGNIKGWFDRRFVFDDVPLSEVIPILERAYGIQIELKNKELEKCRLQARFSDEPAERVIELIAETFSLRIININGRYVLDGAACEY